MINRETAIPLDELRRRYDALGPIKEYTGERTFAGRCCNFENFINYGPVFADAIVNCDPVEDVVTDYPGLAQLTLEAWPQR
jgi:hypothetical protein